MNSDDLNSKLHEKLEVNQKRVRIQELGGRLDESLLTILAEVAIYNPALDFYVLSRSLEVLAYLEPPRNFFVTALWGGECDYMIEEGYFSRHARLVASAEEARIRELPILKGENLFFRKKPFAMLNSDALCYGPHLPTPELDLDGRSA